MPSFVLFPFTDKINEQNIYKVFVLSLSGCFELKILICSVLPKTQTTRDSTYLQFESIYFWFA